MLSTLSKLTALVVAALFLGAAIHWRGRLRATVVRYFTTPATPFNLAVARILFFASALLSLPALDAVRSYAHLPSALIVPPSNGGHLLASLPITDTWVVVAYGLTLGGAILGLIGLLPRFASAAYVVGAFYYLGIPQIYGKVDHSHYLLWIGAIFAVSRSADALSVQALWAAWRRPEEQPVEPVQPSLQYSLPLRFIWLLLGFLYLSAGSAKYRFDGLVWFQPDTLRHWLHLIWFESGYRPPILHGVDHFSPLLVIGAAFTLVFETTFILWIFSERARPFLAGAAILFHNGTRFLMNISFLGLQVVDLTLVDWERLSLAAFRRRAPLSFVYDGNCGTCKKAVLGLRSLAPPGSVAFVNALDREEMRRRGIDWLDSDATLRDVHVVVGRHASVGYQAYRTLARRVPALWPFVPLLALPPVAAIGRRVYRHVADSRSCSVEPAPVAIPARRRRPWPVVAVGVPLLTVLAVVGLSGLRSTSASATAINGWPFASYPSFAGVPSDTTTVLAIKVRAHGAMQTVDLRGPLRFMSSDRRAGLIASIVGRADPVSRVRALMALIQVVAPVDARERRVTDIVVDKEVVEVPPSRAGVVLRSVPVLSVRSVSGSAQRTSASTSTQ
jgi:predicted DCC family thiol-disulfide oxidoreductase YuxK